MEFLVVDGGSTDGTQAIVLAFSKKHLKFKKIDSAKGRAVQMNVGASKSIGRIPVSYTHLTLPTKRIV